MACKDSESADKTIDRLAKMIVKNRLADEMKDYKDRNIYFKNGSYIKVISPEAPTSRGKRADIKPYYNDCEIYYNKEMIDEVLKPFCNKKKFTEWIKWWRKHPSEYIYLTSGKKLKWWHRIWIDKIIRLFVR